MLDEQAESKYRTVVTTGQKHSWLSLTYLKMLGPLNCSLCIQIAKLVDLKKIYDLNSFCFFSVVETVTLFARGDAGVYTHFKLLPKLVVLSC